MKVLCLIFVFFISVFAADEHPCFRTCNASEPPQVCNYKFKIETTYTLSRACFNCPANITDCFRPHCITADGIKRAVMAVNRQIPGPIIQVCQGDTIQVDVTNGILATGSGIHWHGIQQEGTQYMDGVPMITQCPIVSGTSFQYTFTAKQAGTHFWHSHSGYQRGDGVFGALIVRQDLTLDPNRYLFDYDLDEHVIIFTDWTHTLLQEKFGGRHYGGQMDYPESIIVNGRGFFQDQDTGEWNSTPLSVFNVQKDGRYRMRLINTGSLDCPIRFSVDNHRITVIALDGVPIAPKVVDTIDTSSGERVDIVLNADQPASSYWMKFMGLTDCAETKAYQLAILHYDESTDDLPPYPIPDYTEEAPEGKIFTPINGFCNDTTDNQICLSEITAVEPMEPTIASNPVDTQIFLPIDFRLVANTNFYDKELYPISEVSDNMQLSSPQVGNITFVYPSSPPLSQYNDVPADTYCSIYNPPANCDLATDYCECTHTIELRLNATTEIILVDEGVGGDESHPFHLHGYSFYVVGMDRLDQNQSITIKDIQEMDRKGLLKRNLNNPVIRDTVAIPNKGYVIIRFSASNPGYWLFHCHLAFHSAAGMDMLFHVGEPEDLPPIPNGFQKCGHFKSS